MLIHRLESFCGIRTMVLNWYKTYLGQQVQQVWFRGGRSAFTMASCFLDRSFSSSTPLTLLNKLKEVARVRTSTQMTRRYMGSTMLMTLRHLTDRTSMCICDVATWMKSNHLQLNLSKTEVLWCVTPRQQHSILDTLMRVCTDDFMPAKSVHDLGIYIDSNISMTTHVSRTVSSCFAALRHVYSIRRSVSQPVFLSLITSLVLSRLDYGSFTLNGITRRLVDRLQSVLNVAARLLYNSRKYNQITQLLCTVPCGNNNFCCDVVVWMMKITYFQIFHLMIKFSEFVFCCSLQSGSASTTMTMLMQFFWVNVYMLKVRTSSYMTTHCDSH